MSRSLPTDDTSRNSYDERAALEITPTNDGLSVDTVRAQFETLHRLGASSGGGTPTFEWLLVKPDADATLHYYLSVDDPQLLDRLHRFARSLFPESYDLTQTTVTLPRPLASDGSQSDEVTESEGTPDSHTLAGIEFHGHAERRRDWQLRLTEYADFYDDGHTASRTPLSAVIETLATAPVPMAFQVLVRPKPDWTADAQLRRMDLLMYEDTPAQRWLGRSLDESVRERSIEDLGHTHAERVQQLDSVDTRRSFDVNARAVAFGESPASSQDAITTLDTAFSEVGHSFYTIQPTVVSGDDAHTLSDHLSSAHFRPAPSRLRRLAQRLPGTRNHSPCLVSDPATIPSFCLVDGAALTTTGKRALDVTPDERSAVARPDPDTLATYRQSGLTLGRPQTEDREATVDSIAVPPSLQPLHTAWFGKTGSGKSTSLVNAILDNHAATDGASIIIEPKGGGMATEYLRAHYTQYGSLDDVYYFDCAETLPALSFFDIRPQLADGIDRTAAVEDVVDHYLDILRQVMGADRFDRAVRSPDIIRYLVKALFDPVNGYDAFGHRDLEAAASRMHSNREAPPVSDDDLARMLGGIAANSKRSFDELMQGVANRIEKIPADKRLGKVFNHVAPGEREAGDDQNPDFDLRRLIDEDVVIIFDMGALRSEAQRVLTLVILSQLWTALKRRHRSHTQHQGRSDPMNKPPDESVGGDGGDVAHETDSTVDSISGDPELPLVNLYLEEASSIAVSDLLSDLLARGREFSLAVTLSMQFPGQLRDVDPTAYAELLNNVSTIVTGNVAVDERFERRFATAEMSPHDVGNRLRALERGQWFVSLPAPFAEAEPRPFVLRSQPLPPGHPEGPQPLSRHREEAAASAIALAKARTQVECGLILGQERTSTSASNVEEDDDENPLPRHSRLDSALPLTKRLPEVVEYDANRHALCCGRCGNRYAPTLAGMRNACNCCHDLAEVDRDDIPIHALNCTLSPEERNAVEYSDRQLAFVQAVYNAHQGRYADLEYDLVRDSMVRLREYVGIDPDAVQELVDVGLLRFDGDQPHRLYTVSAKGRSLIHEGHRRGISHGDGRGDLSESSQHVLMVEVGRRYLDAAFVDDPESAAVEAVTYHPVGDDGSRLDAACLDEDGEVVVTLEAERLNHDVNTGVPSDYDKMAACNPEAAIWITMSRTAAHRVLQVLNDPPDGEQRVSKTYSEQTPPQRFRLDASGCSAIYTLRYVQNSLETA